MKVLLFLVLACCMALISGCMGTCHGYECYRAEGPYFRATRMDADILIGRTPVNKSVTIRDGIETVDPGMSFFARLPFVLIDLPFALVLDTVLVPFIATGNVNERSPYSPRPENVPGSETQKMNAQQGAAPLPSAPAGPSEGAR